MTVLPGIRLMQFVAEDQLMQHPCQKNTYIHTYVHTYMMSAGVFPADEQHYFDLLQG